MEDDIQRREAQLSLSEAGDRYHWSWVPNRPRRLMILVHGFGEHAGRYDEMAMHFARRGFAVHSFDQAGHGRTAGPRGHVDRFDRLLEEVVEFVRHARELHPGLHTTLVGHSMGGLVVAASVALRNPPIEEMILSGALLDLGGDASGVAQSLKLMLARVLSRIAPRVAFETGLDPEGISRDPEVVRRYREDPFVMDRMSARFAAGLTDTIRALQASAPGIVPRTLILHGGLDPMIPASASQAFFDALPGTIADRSALQIYPELRHEIFQEPEREQVWQDMLDWLENA